MGCQAKDFLNVPAHVQRLEDTIALVQYKVLDPVQLEVLVPCQTQDPTGRPHHNVGAVVGENLDVLLDGNSPVKDGRLDGRKVLAKALVLVGNLKGQFAGVADDQDAGFGFLRANLLECGEREHGRLSHSGLGLADNVSSQYGLGDGLVLYLRGMLKSGVDNRSQEFRFEHEILEPGRVDSNIVAPVVFVRLISF